MKVLHKPKSFSDKDLVAFFKNTSSKLLLSFLNDNPEYIIQSLKYKPFVFNKIPNIQNMNYLECIAANPKVIKYIKDATDEMVIIAIKKDPFLINTISQRSDLIIKTCLDVMESNLLFHEHNFWRWNTFVLATLVKPCGSPRENVSTLSLQLMEYSVKRVVNNQTIIDRIKEHPNWQVNASFILSQLKGEDASS